MPKFRVCYRRGSFTLADDCENYGEALARARYLKSQRGVWTVRLVDTAGVLVRGDFDLEGSLHGCRPESASHDAERSVPDDRSQADFAANSFQ
ncbi:MAG TPA: hypothetical protein VHU18_13080 [Rhizomicrobium sp.]|nr:hypothetical protein [Rhizomicrobium sp.]